MDLLTVQETATLLKVSDGTVRRHAAAGRLPGVRVGRLIRIRREEVERFLEPINRGFDLYNSPLKGQPITEDDPLWSIIGIIKDGPSDLSENHDHYFAEAYADLHLEDDDHARRNT